MEQYTQRINAVLERILADDGDVASERLAAAMRYCVLGNGKRMRPQLVYACGALLGVAAERLDAPAAAVELIHAYSLVHDDLPAMDDDALRRGRPTAHVAFDPATAILAGDALQALAFEQLAGAPALADDPAGRARALATLAHACGARGMVGGQALDMAAEGCTLTQSELETVHARKTGALLRACVLIPADLTAGLAAERRAALDVFARRIGLAFQVRDDVLDVAGTTQTLGKTGGADQAHGKATYPGLMGLAAAKAYAQRLADEAEAALAEVGGDDSALRALARAVVERSY